MVAIARTGTTIAVAIRNTHRRTLRSLALEDGVDKGGKRTALREDDQHAKKQQQDHDRQQPPLLLPRQEFEVLSDDPQLFHASLPSGINYPGCLIGSNKHRDTKLFEDFDIEKSC